MTAPRQRKPATRRPKSTPAATRAATPRQNPRALRLERALASKEPLTKVQALINETTAAGQTFRFAFACLLETRSATLTILFDRFEDDELARIEQSLDAIQASRTLADFRKLKRAFDDAVASGQDRFDASDAVASRADLAAIGRRHKAQVAEMERRLLAYCRAHLREL